MKDTSTPTNDTPRLQKLYVPKVVDLVDDLHRSLEAIALRDHGNHYARPSISDYNNVSLAIESLFLNLAERVSLSMLLDRPVYGGEVIDPKNETIRDEHISTFMANNRNVTDFELRHSDQASRSSFFPQFTLEEKKLRRETKEQFMRELRESGLNLRDALRKFKDLDEQSASLESTMHGEVLYPPFEFSIKRGLISSGVKAAANVAAATTGNVAAFFIGASLSQMVTECFYAVHLPHGDISNVLRNIGRVFFREEMRQVEPGLSL